jgi:alkanesulfonate monooxygenase SsuD/methylene tetrahydromethanopterin reductase-like flavin-dependent oxidoreductase (luciferase family)
VWSRIRTAAPPAIIVAAGLLVAAALVLAVLTVAGTGPFASEEVEELDRQSFLARGDEICRLAQEEFEELQQDPPRTASEAADLTANLVEISEQELEEIRDLGVPESLEEPLERYLDAREEGIDLLRDAQQAAEEGDEETYVQAQAEVREGQLERTTLAEAVGFSECSRPLPGSAPDGEG